MSQIALSMQRSTDIYSEIERLRRGIRTCQALIAEQGPGASVPFRATPYSAHFYGSILPRRRADTLCTDIIASNQGKIDQLEAELARREAAAPPDIQPPERDGLPPVVWVAVGAALVWLISKK